MAKEHDKADDKTDADKPAAKAPNSHGRSVLPPSTIDQKQAPAPQQVDVTRAGGAERVGGKLTRKGMEQTLAAGMSVTLGTNVYSTPESLPTQDQIDEHYRQVDQQNADLAAQQKR